MKISFCPIFLLLSLTVLAKTTEAKDNWPCYLKKCSRNDPNLNKCILDHANRALEFILLGDPKIGIPNFAPYMLQNINFGTNKTFKVHFDEITVSGMHHLYINDINWNFKAKTMELKIGYNNAITLGGDYVSSGYFQDKCLHIDAEGKGRADIVFVGGQYGANLTYCMQYELLKILGKEYIQIKDRVCNHQEGFRTNFYNQLASKEENLSRRKLINTHAAEANNALDAEIKELICLTVDKALNPVFYNFAIDDIFN